MLSKQIRRREKPKRLSSHIEMVLLEAIKMGIAISMAIMVLSIMAIIDFVQYLRGASEQFESGLACVMAILLLWVIRVLIEREEKKEEEIKT